MTEHPDVGDQTYEIRAIPAKFNANTFAYLEREEYMDDLTPPRTLRQYDERQPLATWQRLAELEKRMSELEGLVYAMMELDGQQIKELSDRIIEHAGQIKHVPDAAKERDV